MRAKAVLVIALVLSVVMIPGIQADDITPFRDDFFSELKNIYPFGQWLLMLLPELNVTIGDLTVLGTLNVQIINVMNVTVQNVTVIGNVTSTWGVFDYILLGGTNISDIYVDVAGDTMTGDLTAPNLNATEIVSSNMSYIGLSEGNHAIYFYEDGSPTGEFIRWTDSSDNFWFSDSVAITGWLSVQEEIRTSAGDIYTQAGFDVFSSGDLYTSGAGDNLWLGAVTQNSANLVAFANGSLYFTEDMNDGTNALTIAQIKNWLTNDTFLNIDGSNANQNINISPFDFEATDMKATKLITDEINYVTQLDIKDTGGGPFIRFTSAGTEAMIDALGDNFNLKLAAPDDVKISAGGDIQLAPSGTSEHIRITFDGSDVILRSFDDGLVIKSDSGTVGFDDDNIITIGTVQAEQLTSTDDITMQGHLLTLGDDTVNDIVIDFKASANDGSITYDESANEFNFGSSNIETLGNLGVGIAISGTGNMGMKLVEGSSTVETTKISTGFNAELKGLSDGTNAKAMTGYTGKVSIYGDSWTANIIGMLPQVIYRGGGTVAKPIGVQGIVSFGTGAAYDGTFTTAKIFNAVFSTRRGTTEIGTFYYVNNPVAPTAPGSYGTLYGMHLDELTRAATNWQIYSAGGNSAFGGYTSFGSTNIPTVVLDVTGDIAIPDSNKYYSGTSKDVSCGFNGTAFICKAEVGSPNYFFEGFPNVVTDGNLDVQDNLTVDTNTLFVNSDNNRVGIGTNASDSIFHIKANTPGTVGSHAAGQLIIQDPDDTVFGNVVITAYESDGAGNPDQQLWYLGSSSGSNTDITFLNRRNANLHLGTNGVSRLTILGNGNVGIGTVEPNATLHVDGTLDVAGVISSPAIYAQLSDLEDQAFASAGVEQAINLTTTDGINGLSVSVANITVPTAGVYSIFAQPQVTAGPGDSGVFHMWLNRYNTTDWLNVSNSNVELSLASNDEDVIPLIVTIKIEAGEQIRVMGSVSDTGITLDAQILAGEPAIPSIIFAMKREGS